MSGVIEPSVAVDGSGGIDRTHLTWSERITIIVILLAAYAPFFLYFLVPSEALFLCLLVVNIVFAIPLAVFSLQELFHLRWKLISIFVLVWVLLCLSFIGPSVPRDWVRVSGFYVRTRLVDAYRSGCHATEFIENGVKQMAGGCEGFDRGQFFEDIVYDTTGEFMRPVSERTEEWKRVMSGATVKAVLSKEHRAYHLFGNYYCVHIDFDDLGS